MYKSHYILGDETRKHEYKVFGYKLTKIKTLAKKKLFAEELDKNKATREKHGSCYARFYLENLLNMPNYFLNV